MDAAFRSAQSRWDAMLPLERDDDPTDAELSEATDQFLTDTWATSDWLNQNLKQPELDTTYVPLRAEDMTSLTIDQLWVLILTGTNQQLIDARLELVDRMCAERASDIEARVPSIRARNLQDAAEYAAELAAEAA